MKKISLLILLSFLIIMNVNAERRYVRQNPYGLQNGSSWSNASNDLQLMINNSVAGDTIWVAEGTYKPIRRADSLNAITINDRRNAFVMKNGVTLIGGFLGYESSISERNISGYETKLSGNLGFADQTYDNSYHVVVVAGVACTIDGFIIENGNANDSMGFQTINGNILTNFIGAGLACTNGQISLNNSIIRNNLGGNGVGISFHYTDASMYYTNVIMNNGTYTGGIHQAGGNVIIKNSSISINQGLNVSGGFSKQGSGITEFKNVSFISNTSNNMGGAVSILEGPTTFDSCNFELNTGNIGGALYSYINNLIVSSSKFIGNTSNSKGGALYLEGNNIEISKCIIKNNSSLVNGGGISTQNSSYTINNVLIIGNSSNKGGGVYNDGTGEMIMNYGTVCNNSAIVSGGGVEGNGPHTYFVNSIVWGNSSGVQWGPTTDASATYSNIQNTLPAGTGNININPQFADTSNPIGIDNTWLTGDDGYNVVRTSPMRGAGYTFSLNHDITNSIRNTPPAIGAYELPPCPIPNMPNDSLSTGVRNICYNTSTTLSVIADSFVVNDSIYWYADSSSNLSIGTGRNYTTLEMIENATLWVGINYCDGATARYKFVINVGNSSSTTIDTSVCTSYHWPVNDSTYTTSGTYIDTITSSFGCDSIITLNLTINNSTIKDTTITTCQFYDYYGQYIFTSGIYDYTFTSSQGCDSTVVLNITIVGTNQFSNSNSIDSVGKVLGTNWYAIDDSCKLMGAIGNIDTSVKKTMELFVEPTAPTFNGQPYVRRYYDIRTDITSPTLVYLLLTEEDVADYNANNGSYPDIDSALTNLKITVFHSDINSGGTGPNGHDINSSELIPISFTMHDTFLNVYQIGIGVNSFSGFYFHTNNDNTPLPILLGDIRAYNQGNENIVVWNTLKEESGDNFVLERSNDGSNFTQLATINAKGNPSEYNFVDVNPYHGTTYYRVNILNNDGTSHLSKIVNATLGSSVNIKAFPNPTNKDVTISVSGKSSAESKIIVTDVSGRILNTIENLTNNEVTISLEQYVQGIYFIKYINGDKLEVIKVTKQ